MHNEKPTPHGEKRVWKSYAELADTEEYRRWADDEFPDRDSLLDLDRRDFLKVGAAGLALAGLSGCRHLPEQRAVPYVRAPENLVAGKALYYATALSRAGTAIGVLVESHMGRPTKIEGNPQHPSSLGATDIWAQAEILSLYDPDRSQLVTDRNRSSSWSDFFAAIRPAIKAEEATGGAGLRLLTEKVMSPVLASQIRALLKKLPNATWHQYQPLSRDASHAGTKLAFGKPVQPVYHLAGAKVILSLDADFLLTAPGSVRYARDFSQGRRVRRGTTQMNRLYVAESSYTLTGASADHRIGIKPGEIEALAKAIYGRLAGGAEAPPSSVPAPWLDALVEDLKANPGAAVAIPGDEQTASVHALAHAINSALGAIGKTVQYVEPADEVQDGAESLKGLVAAMDAGKVRVLLILGGNPVYDAPADLKFGAALLAAEGDKERVPLRIRLGLHEDETSDLCHWHLPESHPLEAWGDARGHDGTVSIVQPLIQPLYDSRSALEVVSYLAGQPVSGYEVVKGYYLQQHAGADDEAWWQTTLHNGVVAGSAARSVAVTLETNLFSRLPAAAQSGGVEINFRPDPTLFDGRYANNSWLQELPKPITTVVWDNAALLGPATAKKMGIIPDEGQNDAVNIAQVSGKQMVKVSVGGASLSLPVWILPGQPADVVTIHLGGGRTRGGNVLQGAGFNAYTLRTSGAMGHAAGKVEALGESYNLSFTQPHHLMRATERDLSGRPVDTENRDIVRSATLEEFVRKKNQIFPIVHHPNFQANAPEHGAEHEGGESHEAEIQADWFRKDWKYVEKSISNKEGYSSLYPEFSNKDYNQWAMSIDLTTCIGCNACTIACQAENNIPTVGKDEVGRGREMHWIRLDHYYAGEDWEKPESYFMPVPCMQCEKAPCEPVCPVAATIHSHEGLNQMVYNRCIGTRYCSNNCPYKVRRFNFLKWTQGVGGPTTLDFFHKPQLKMLSNPDVTVRGRGVMEKCTYCVQRINERRIEAKKEGREIQDGEILTACQQVCPTQAIVFGDINNPHSQVSKLKLEPHDYTLLADLNTRPRTTYLARIKNVHPSLAGATGIAAEGAKE